MNIKTLIALPALVTLAIFAALMLLAYTPAQSSAHEGDDHEENSQQNEKAYKYTAQAGDSYTAMARKAVQTYGVNNKVDLSGNRIVYAETNITTETGSPELSAGQEVTISEETVKSWVDKAKALNDEQASAWDIYVPSVNFDTNDVGEARQ